MVQFHHHQCSTCTKRIRGIIKTRASDGVGKQRFISYDSLLHNSNNSYYKSDFLIFRISYEHMEAPYQVAPITVNVTKFSYWLESMKEWHSSPFFAFEGGYQMCLRVYSSGNGVGEGTQVSVSLNLMKGSHDDKLEQSGYWPLRGIFIIEVLNQFNDNDNLSLIMQFHDLLCYKCTNRILDEVTTYSGFGQQQFISHPTLYNHSYIKENSLMLRISYESIEPPNQIGPVTFKLTKFSLWLTSKKEWFSSPFFTFNGGYQVFLRVVVAGCGIGETTHVSIYLYLMEGPHDDKLEQSGYWPMRGTFIIELLNQLSDSNHHSYTVYYTCSGFHRVKMDLSIEIGFLPLFISHNTLFQHNGYLKNDILNFRIAYTVNSDGS